MVDENRKLLVEEHRLAVPFEVIENYSFVADASECGVALLAIRFTGVHHRQLTGMMKEKSKYPRPFDLMPWARFQPRGD